MPGMRVGSGREAGATLGRGLGCGAGQLAGPRGPAGGPTCGMAARRDTELPSSAKGYFPAGPGTLGPQGDEASS
jgi:hypothetical protein